MQKVIKSMEKIQKMEPKIYLGKGEFEIFTIEFQPKIEKKKIKELAKKNALILPNDYEELLAYSNGLVFYKYADCQIYNLEKAISYTKEMSEHGKEYLEVATCREDSIYMKCDGSHLNMYVSEEDIEDLRPLNMTFKSFLECGLISGFAYFWLWGRGKDGLY